MCHIDAEVDSNTVLLLVAYFHFLLRCHVALSICWSRILGIDALNFKKLTSLVLEVWFCEYVSNSHFLNVQ